jgi:hypothetical protein
MANRCRIYLFLITCAIWMQSRAISGNTLPSGANQRPSGASQWRTWAKLGPSGANQVSWAYLFCFCCFVWFVCVCCLLFVCCVCFVAFLSYVGINDRKVGDFRWKIYSPTMAMFAKLHRYIRDQRGAIWEHAFPISSKGLTPLQMFVCQLSHTHISSPPQCSPI